MNAQSMLAWTRGWSWPKFAGGVAVACAVLYVKENGRSLFMSPFVTLKPDVTSEKLPMFEDAPMPYPETKEDVVKHITERRVYDPLMHERFKPKEAEFKRQRTERHDALAVRLRDDIAHELISSGDYATKEALNAATHVLEPPRAVTPQ